MELVSSFRFVLDLIFISWSLLLFCSLHQQCVHMTSFVFRAGVSCPQIWPVYLLFILPWRGYRLNNSFSIMNWVRVRPQTRKAYKKYLQYHQLEKSIILYQEAGVVRGPVSRFRPTKEKISCFREDFASLGDSSSPQISQWHSELPIFTKHSCSLVLIQDRPRVAGAVKDTLLYLHYEQPNLKWVPEIPVFVFNVSNCWWRCGASKGCFLNGIQYLHAEQLSSEKWYFSVLETRNQKCL